MSIPGTAYRGAGEPYACTITHALGQPPSQCDCMACLREKAAFMAGYIVGNLSPSGEEEAWERYRRGDRPDPQSGHFYTPREWVNICKHGHTGDTP